MSTDSESGEMEQIICAVELDDHAMLTMEYEDHMLCTLEIVSDENTPKIIKQALKSPQKELWRKSAIAEVNNFLKRDSWKFVLKEYVRGLKRKIIGVKWVFKIKHEPDYSLRYKSRIVVKGYMQIPGVDYTEKFSPVAQATTVRTIIAIALYEGWDCELVDIEAAFLEGRLERSAYIELPPGMVELGFMTIEEYNKLCIELQGGRVWECRCCTFVLYSVYRVRRV